MRARSSRRRSRPMERRCLDKLLSLDLLDWITPWEVDMVVCEVRRNPDRQRDLAVRTVEYGLEADLILIGDIEDGFVPWDTSDRASTVKRFEDVWRSQPPDDKFRLGFWLDRTPRGWVRGYALVARTDLRTRLELAAMDRILGSGLRGLVGAEVMRREHRRVQGEFKRARKARRQLPPGLNGILRAGLYQAFFEIGKVPEGSEPFRALPTDNVYKSRFAARSWEGELCLKITDAGIRRAHRKAG